MRRPGRLFQHADARLTQEVENIYRLLGEIFALLEKIERRLSALENP